MQLRGVLLVSKAFDFNFGLVGAEGLSLPNPRGTLTQVPLSFFCLGTDSTESTMREIGALTVRPDDGVKSPYRDDRRTGHHHGFV